jgi:sigma-B regulation protein RsbU (phosphoserine phosphatase)
MEGEHGRLLLVEDDETLRLMLRRYLVRGGFTVVEAADGNQALAEMQTAGPFDLVLLDTMLPGVSGLEVLQTLRRTRSATDLPIIMATACDRSEDVVEALRLGANDYLAKPFDFSVALARIRTQLALKGSVARIRRLEQDLAQRNAELEKANQRMRHELEAAARVQQALLPETPPELPGARFAWLLRPCAELAGDSLNVVVLDERHVALDVLDVVGHGAKAALLAVMVSRVLEQMLTPTGSARSSIRPEAASPAAVAERLNRAFPWNDRTQQFFSLLHGVLDVGSGEFAFISAGHPGPVLLPRDGPGRTLEASGTLIGLGSAGYKESRVVLRPGERLYLYTDGVVEAARPGGEEFGKDRLLAVLEQSRGLPLADSLAVLVEQIEAWCRPQPLQDDLSLLAVEMVPSEAGTAAG